MSTKYEWKIGQLEIVPSENGLTDIVKTVDWSYSATEDDCVATTYGQTELNSPDTSTFIAFKSLTEDDVLMWVKLAMGEALLANHKTNVNVLLQEKLAVKTKLVAPPWQKQAV